MHGIGMTAYFVTAIGTDIGKTYISAGLLAAWRDGGKSVRAVKPVMSGFGENALAASDAGHLLTAMGRPVSPQTISEICLHRFAPPLSPNVAMRRAGMTQDYDAILKFTRSILNDAGPGEMKLVEGAGGVMTPLTDHKLHIDFMEDLSLPIILVAASYLGAVSHTLTAINAIRSRGLQIAAVVASQPAPDAQDPAHLIGEIGLFETLPCFRVGHGEGVSELASALLRGGGAAA